MNLIIATQRPTQAAMGGNAVRSQMDVRICLRVRERRDTDLILGPGITGRRMGRARAHPARHLPDIRTPSTPPPGAPAPT